MKLEVLVDPGGWTNYWGNVTDTRNIAKVLDVFSRFLQISNINIRMESTPGFRTVQNYFKAFDMEILEFSSWHQLVTKRCTATKKICRKNNLVFHDIDVLCHHFDGLELETNSALLYLFTWVMSFKVYIIF